MQFIKLFLIFFKIGAFTFGGGYAMIPLIQIEVVDKNKWLTNEEFLDTIAVSQSSPGAIAVNISIMIGYKLNGLRGAIFSVLGVVLPSFIIILIISMFLYKYRDNDIIDKIFLGIRPAVVALISSAVYKLIKASNYKGKILIIPVVVAISIVFFNVSPIIVIVLAGIFGVIYNQYIVNNKE